jgi:Zn-dependent membrane protease YugP
MITYYLIGGVAFVVTMLIQSWLKSTYSKWTRVGNAAGLTGAQTARAILNANGLPEVKVEAVKGQLTDHYDPRSRTVRLSEGNYGHANVAGLAVAAHEVGHAIQHAQAYAPLRFRAALVPVANIGSQFGPMLAIFGIFLGAGAEAGGAGGLLLQLGIFLFAGAVLFHLVTLPVEFDASRRALAQLQTMGLVTRQDAGGAKAVLTAAAMTYVAAAATAIAYLIYFILASRRR